MRTISVNVSDATADKFFLLSKEEQLVAGKFFDVFFNDNRSMEQVMEDISKHAKENGLTPEILADILEIDMDEMNRIMGIE